MKLCLVFCFSSNCHLLAFATDVPLAHFLVADDKETILGRELILGADLRGLRQSCAEHYGRKRLLRQYPALLMGQEPSRTGILR